MTAAGDSVRDITPPFCRFTGQRAAKLALVLNLVDPRVGGALFVGARGCGKSTLARAARHLLPPGVPFVEVPLNATEEALLGGIDIEKAIRVGGRIEEEGLLAKARGGILFIDDVNLLGTDVLNLTLDAQEFAVVATMNPEEGPLSSHVLDRFGLCHLFEAVPDAVGRRRIVRFGMDASSPSPPIPSPLKEAKQASAAISRHRARDARIARRIVEARRLLPSMSIPEETRELVVSLALDAWTDGHRGDVALQRAASAYAAFCGRTEVTERDVLRVARLALVHRARVFDSAPPEARREPPPRDREPEDDKRDDNSEPPPPPSENDGESEEHDSPPEPPTDSDDATPPGEARDRNRPEDRVFSVGDSFKVRRLLFQKDRIERMASGRRTRTRFAGKGGRYVKSILRRREDDIAVDATLRAAAPWQRARGRVDRVLIRDEDLRFKQRERRMGHLVLFVLDCSGSMGARKRMVETKGAVLSLLMDCYQKRDRVAMIVFRKDRAETVLPPTGSVELASTRLRDLPVGGRTPLAAALLEAHRMVKQVAMKERRRRFVVVLLSDGRANQGIAGNAGALVREEIARCAEALRDLPQTDYLVVDTEDKSTFMRADLAAGLASALGADYFCLNDLRAEILADLVRERTGA